MSKLSTRQRIVLKALAANYFVVSKACKEAKIERKTYYRWLEQPEFKKKVDEVDQDLLVIVEDRLKVEALNSQPWAIRFYLSRRHPDYKAKVEMSGGPEFFLGNEDEE